MPTLTIRAMHDIAYERGEDYDPAAISDAASMAADLQLGRHAGLPVEAPSAYDRRRAQDRARREALAGVPGWLTAKDVLARPAGVHGELI